MKSNKNTGRFSAKGYYIALILCAAAIGISGYLYYRNANINDSQLQKDPTDASAVNPSEDDVPVVAPNPDATTGTQATRPGNIDATQSTVGDTLKTCSPLSGETIGDYAMDCLAYNETTRDWRTHDGIDIAAEAGTTVRAAADGTVYTTYTDESMGTTVIIRHNNGYVTVYSSLAEELLVKAGDTVTMGQAIGAVGNTAVVETAMGDHLHFAVTCNDKAVDPADFFDLD